MKKQNFLTHVKQDGEIWRTHELHEHLQGVAKFAESFAAHFSSGDWGKIAGELHDLGKGSQAFQNKIAYKSGYNPEASIKDGESNAPHSTHGAVWAFENITYLK